MKKILLIISTIFLITGCVSTEEIYTCTQESTFDDYVLTNEQIITGINDEVLIIEASSTYITDNVELKEELESLSKDSDNSYSDIGITYHTITTDNSVRMESITPINEETVVLFENEGNNAIDGNNLIMSKHINILEANNYVCKKESK